MHHLRELRHRQRGAVLITAVVFAAVGALLLGGSLLLAQESYQLSYGQSRSEAAYAQAEAGLNDELSYISLYQNLPPATSSSCGSGNTSNQSGAHCDSDPPVNTGSPLVFPGDGSAVKGRSGTVSGATSAGNYWVFACNGNLSQPWSGLSGGTIEVISTGYEDGEWKRVTASGTAGSIFSQYALFAIGGYGNSNQAVKFTGNSVITVTGTIGTNFKVTHNAGTLTSTGCLNAGSSAVSNGYNSTNLATGGTLYSVANPVVFRTCEQILEKLKGLTYYDSSSDTTGWTYISSSSNNVNASGVYTWKSGAGTTMNTTNCSKVSGGVGSSLADSLWTSSAGSDPNLTSTKTIIFEPGDYYFTSISLTKSGEALVADPLALASGGTAGQVRFWVNSTSADTLGAAIYSPNTNGTGYNTTNADPSGFRLYYSNTKKALGLSPPVGAPYVFGCFYAVSAPYGDANYSSAGATEIDTVANTFDLQGSLIADQLWFKSNANIVYRASNTKFDPAGSVTLTTFSDGQ